MGGEGGVVLVYTTRSLPAGSTLQMTYGAGGNAAHLSRHGFAIRIDAGAGRRGRSTEFQGVVSSSGVRSRTSANVDNGLRDFYRSVRRDDSSDDDAVDNGDDDDANVEGDDPDCSHDAHEISASEQYDLSSVRRRSIIDDIGAIDIVRERLRNVRAGLVNNPLFGPPNGEIFTVGSYSNHHRRHPSFAGRRVLRRCRGNCPPVYLIVSVVFPVPFCY